MWTAMKAAKQIISRSIIRRDMAALFRVISLRSRPPAPARGGASSADVMFVTAWFATIVVLRDL